METGSSLPCSQGDIPHMDEELNAEITDSVESICSELFAAVTEKFNQHQKIILDIQSHIYFI
jgi:hypothetical protein